MLRNGWKVDVGYSSTNDIKSSEYSNICGTQTFYGYHEDDKVGSVSAKFKGNGNATLIFGNCHKEGFVEVLLNNQQLGQAKQKKYKTIAFSYYPGDVLKIREVNTAIIKLYYFGITGCKGKLFSIKSRYFLSECYSELGNGILKTLYCGFLYIDEPKSNESTLQFREKGNDILLIPPCQDISKESFGVQKCCSLLSNHLKRANLKPVMSLMKHSLELTNPWYSHYYNNQDDNEIKYDSEMVKYLNKAWLVENNDAVMKIFSDNPNGDFLHQFG